MFQRISATALTIFILIFGIVSPALAQGKSSNVVGTWVLRHNWGCDSNYGLVEINFLGNGTFTTEANGFGTWINQDGMLIFQYSDTGTVYAGPFIGKHAVGAQKQGGNLTKGCFAMGPVGSFDMTLRDGSAIETQSDNPAE